MVAPRDTRPTSPTTSSNGPDDRATPDGSAHTRPASHIDMIGDAEVRAREHALDLCGYLAAAPSPYHAVVEATLRLDAAGFTRLDPTEVWPNAPGAYYVARAGNLIAWVVSAAAAPAPHTAMRIVGAHTDSPNLRIKPNPDTGSMGWRQLGIEVYGGALRNSWLDRDLGVSGRVTVRTAAGPATRLVKVDRPIARVPQLAIHLDRDVNDKGLKLNPQQHLVPVWGLGAATPGDFTTFLAAELSAAGDTMDPTDVIAWNAMFHDLAPPAFAGRDGEMIASGRLDDLCSSHAAITALAAGAPLAADAADAAADVVPVVCLFDHEEVGSTSATGAAGAWLAHVLERSVVARGGTRDDWLRALAGSLCVSADMAHATHPNYPERHDPDHLIRLDEGPVVKTNANQRYATDAETAAAFAEACDEAGVPLQQFVNRSDLPCGSTIGPVTAAGLAVPTVDVGVAQLAMHSAREMCGAHDPARLAWALTSFFGFPI